MRCKQRCSCACVRVRVSLEEGILQMTFHWDREELNNMFACSPETSEYIAPPGTYVYCPDSCEEPEEKLLLVEILITFFCLFLKHSHSIIHLLYQKKLQQVH